MELSLVQHTSASKREFGKLGVHRTGRASAAPVEVETVGVEAAEFERWQRGNGFTQRFRAHGIFDPRQRQVRFERAPFRLESQRFEQPICFRGQSSEIRRSFNACP